MILIILTILILFTLVIICCCVPTHKIPALNELPMSSKSNLNICIFMIVTPEILDYARYTIERNREYANLNGYDFKVFGKLRNDLPIQFSKLQATLDLTRSDYDYIIHIDADAIVRHKALNYRFENIIYEYMPPHVSFIAGEDCYSHDVCSKPGHINSGVYIVRNDFIGKAIIKKWLSSVLPGGKCEEYKNIFPNCQLVFSNCVLKSVYRPFIKIVPYNIMNGKDGLFIQHMMQHTLRERIDSFKFDY